MDNIKLSRTTINFLRDRAVDVEKKNLKVAYELMQLAQSARPDGKFIRNKIAQYEEALTYKAKFDELISSGELAIIPVGFRCYTKQQIQKKLGLKQQSFPFDSGFFPPSSVTSILKNPKVNLVFGNKDSQTVCIKKENAKDVNLGKGVHFATSDYAEINELVDSATGSLNKFLDSTFGYYTVDFEHQYVLAHYNWHEKSSFEKSQGMCDPKINLVKINEMMNRRIQRMIESCHQAKYVVFVNFEDQGYSFMGLDEKRFDLNDFSELKSIVREKFGSHSYVVKLSSVDTHKKLLSLIGCV